MNRDMGSRMIGIPRDRDQHYRRTSPPQRDMLHNIQHRDMSNASIHHRDMNNASVHHRDMNNASVHHRDMNNTSVHHRDMSNAGVHHRDMSNASSHHRDTMGNASVQHRDMSNSNVHHRDMSNSSVQHRDSGAHRESINNAGVPQHDELIRFICDSWTKVIQEYNHQRSNPQVPQTVLYHSENDQVNQNNPHLKDFVPFDLESWSDSKVRRLVHNT